MVMNLYAVRLVPQQDLKQALVRWVDKNAVEAGCILTAVGSLSRATLRFAGQSEATVLEQPFEVISLSGTLAKGGVHLHLAIADASGQMRGGHLMDGCLIRTTAEIVIGDLNQFAFSRVFDRQTGYRELTIERLMS